MRIVDQQTFHARLTALESWIWSAGAALLGHPMPTPETLVARVEELSDAYTVDRADLAHLARRGCHLTPRLLYFLCSDAPKLHLVLRELEERHGQACVDGRATVDLGCGVGASVAGFLLSIDARSVGRLRLVGVDLDPTVLPIWMAVARRCAEIAGVSVDLATRTCALAHFDSKFDSKLDSKFDSKFDAGDDTGDNTSLLIAQAVLNECLDGPDGAIAPDADLVRQVGSWARGHPCLLLEPALRLATRPLHALRDAVLARGGVRVLAPCPHQGRCPMLDNPRDWCHEVRSWPPTPRVAAVQERTRRRDDRLKFSFVALAPAVAPGGVDAAGSAADGPLRARLVSDPLASKGKVERFACTSEGRLRRLRLLDRERTAATGLLAEARRGTMLDIEGLTASERVSADVRVSLSMPAATPPPRSAP